jgi:lactose/L-arabinose transport system ATP-binding protein
LGNASYIEWAQARSAINREELTVGLSAASSFLFDSAGIRIR